MIIINSLNLHDHLENDYIFDVILNEEKLITKCAKFRGSGISFWNLNRYGKI